MQTNEFNRLFSIDTVPSGKVCNWCDKLAEKQITAIGGNHHNKSGAFCHSCGEQFSQCIDNALPKVRSGLFHVGLRSFRQFVAPVLGRKTA